MGAIPVGLCQCGCGERTTIAAYTAKRDHMVKGEPMRYVNGHVRRVGLSVEARFWPRVDKIDGGCWEWTGGLNTHGYGHLRAKQLGLSAPWALCHRLSFEWANGPIPNGLQVLHKCDNPRCVKPEHLFLGTTVDNVKDKVSKRRQSLGARHGMAKLTEAQAIEIRALKKQSVPTKEIAAQFSVTAEHVNSIARGESWPHLGGAR